MRKGSSRWWIVFLLFSGTFINAIDRYSISSAGPVLMTELGLNEKQMGFVLSSFFWFYMIFNVPAGWLADKFGAKRTLGWAATIWSVSSALTGRAGNFFHLLLARFGVGAGESAGYPVNAKIVNNHFTSRERGAAVGCYNAGLRLGFAVTPVLMAWLIGHWGWRCAFYATGLGSLAWVAIWYFTYVETTQDSPQTAVPAKIKIPVLELVQNRTVMGLVLTKFFQDYLLYLFVTWLPGYLVLDRGFSILQMGWYASLPWVAGFIAQPLVGGVSDFLVRRGFSVTFSRKSVLIVLYLLSATAVIAGYANDPMLAVWLLTISVAAESGATAILWTACVDVAPAAAAGSLAGIMNTAGAFAGILAPMVTGILAQSTGHFQLPLAIGSCMVLAAAGSIWLVAGELAPLKISAIP